MREMAQDQDQGNPMDTLRKCFIEMQGENIRKQQLGMHTGMVEASPSGAQSSTVGTRL